MSEIEQPGVKSMDHDEEYRKMQSDGFGKEPVVDGIKTVIGIVVVIAVVLAIVAYNILREIEIWS